MNFAFSATKNMYTQLTVCIRMLFATQKNIDMVYCFIEDSPSKLKIKNPKIKFIDVSKYTPIIKNTMNGSSRWTYIVLARCYFTELLPEVDKILYLDLDTIPTRDLQPFYDVDMSENSIMGVEDTGVVKFHRYLENTLDNYLNSGVLLMNLKFMREQGINKKLDYLLNTVKFDFPDQDALNVACQETMLVTDNRWNSSLSTGIAENPFIIHTTGNMKPWVVDSPYFKLWCEYYFNQKLD